MAQNLFQNFSEIPLGARIQFHFKWSQWIQTVCPPVQIPVKANECLQSNETKAGNMNDEETIKIASEAYSINLITILKSNSYGKSLIETFKETKVMTENLRKLLCESILQYCIESRHELSVIDCASLANQICAVFPGEEMVYFVFSEIHYFICSTLIQFSFTFIAT